MASEMRRVLHFAGGGLPPDTLEVVSFEGREAISSLFRFDIELVSQKEDIDFTAMLQESSVLAIKQGVALKGSAKGGVQTLKIHGVLSSIEEYEKGLDWVRYRAVLVPGLWRLSLNVQSQIYMEKTVPEIIEEELKGAGFTSSDYEFRTKARKYSKREYVVQYLESDFAFISRLCEQEGIFYYFEHTDEAAKIVFGDAPESFVEIQGNAVVPFRPESVGRTRVETTGEERSNDDWFQTEVVQTLRCQQRMIPAEVLLKDYNYRSPGEDLKAAAPVTEDGVGRVYEFGDHFKDVSEGKVYARIRAEERKCRQKVFVGTSDSRAFRAGSTFSLADHYRGDWNMKYLITEVRHQASQPIQFLEGLGTVASYRNEFTGIPYSVPFRPERVTPKPRVAGLLNAKIDASGDGQYAEIDDEGRYKVQLPFDLTGRSQGKASRYIRMAQPYAGGGMGMHFPLHKGTEVILGHVNGDPDRPIIVAAVTNPETTSPVKGGNATQCAIHTGGGNALTIEDTAGNQRIHLSSPTSGTSLSMGSPLT